MQVAVQEGAELPDGDPIVKAHGDMFGKAKRATHTHAPKKTAAKRATKAKK